MERKDDLPLLQPIRDNVLTGSFEDRDDPNWRFIVLANLDLDKPATCVLQPLEKSVQMVHVDTHGGHVRLVPLHSGTSLTLEPGDGTMIFLGATI